ncbi:MAG: two-component regulator propeller domain-containing protein [Caldilineaceae bacterium]
MKTIIGKEQAPPLPRHHSTWKSYTNGNFVHALLVQDECIWAATSGGVVRWDRRTNEYIKYTTQFGLASNAVSGLCQDQTGTLWFGTYDSGLCALDQEGHWTYFAVNRPFDSNRIQALYLTREDTLWVSTPHSVYQLDTQGEWQQHDFASVVAIYQSRDGALWFGLFEGGMVRLAADGTVTRYNHADMLGEGITVYATYQTADDALWFGGYESGIRRMDKAGHWSQVLEGETDWYGVTSIAQAVDGSMWFGRFDRLLCRRDNDAWEQIGLFDGHDRYAALPGVTLQRVGTTLWLGLWGEGIVRIEADGDALRYVTADPITANAIGAITQSADGDLWFGTNGQGLNRLRAGGAWTTYTERAGLVSQRILAICPSRDGTLWVGMAAKPGSDQTVIQQLDGEGRWQTVANAPISRNGSVTTIAQRFDGSLWFGMGKEGAGGVYCLHPDGRWERVFAASAFAGDDRRSSENYINQIFAAADGTLWFAMPAGLRCLDRQDRWQEFTTVNGQSLAPIIAMTQRADGPLWFATAHNQLWRRDRMGQWTEIELPTDFDGEVTALCADADGMVWLSSRSYMGTAYGLLRLDSNQQWQRFDTADGLASCLINAIYASRDGTLWLGTDGGLCRYDRDGEYLMHEEKQASTYYQVNHSTIEITMPDGSPATPEVLYEALNDKDAEVGVSAALQLAKLGDLSPIVTNTLFDATDWRSDPEASSAARYGITELAKTNPVMIDLLLIALQANQRSLSGVAECLGEIGQATPAVIKGLLAFSQSSDDAYAVVSALHSLLQLGYATDAIVQHLLTLRRQGDMIVRSVALQALGLLQEPSPEVANFLLAAAQRKASRSPDAADRLRTTDPDDPQWTTLLMDALKAEVGQTRRTALKALGAMTNPPANVVEILCAALADADWSVRQTALDGLRRLGNPDPQVIDRLLVLLAAEETKRQARSTHSQQSPALEENEEDVRAILATLNENQSLRGDVAMTLAQLGCINDAVIAAFLAELDDKDESVRERIVRNWWLLGKDNPSVLAALHAALHDESAMVRLSAAASLERLG